MLKIFIKLFLVFIISFACISNISFCFADNTSKELYESAKDAMLNDSYYEAIEIYTELVKQYPDYVDLYYDRAEAYDKIHDYDNALKDLDIYIEANPWSLKGYEKRGFVNLSKEDYKEALKDYSRAIEISPENVTNRLLRMRVNFELKNYRQVLDDCDKVKNDKEKEDDVLKWRGYVAFATKNYNDAINLLTKAIGLRERLTESSEYYFNRAEYSSYADKEDEAIFFKRGIAYMRIGNQKAAISDFHKGVDVLLNSRVIFSGQETVAVQSISEAITAFPIDTELRKLRILLYERYSRIQEAETDAEAILQSNPGDKTAIFILAKICFSKSDYAHAIKLFDKVEKEYPGSEEFFYYRGLSRAFLEQYEDSIQDIRKAASLSSDPDALFMSLSNIIRAEEKPNLLDRIINDWIKTLPGSTTAKFAKWCLMEDRNDKSADSYMKKVVDSMSGNNDKAAMLVTFSKHLVEKNKPEKAMNFLNMAEKQNSQDVTISISMVKSMAHLALKEYEKSKNYSIRVIERFSPKNKDKYIKPGRLDKDSYETMEGDLFMTNACSFAMLGETLKAKETLLNMVNKNMRANESVLFEDCRKTMDKDKDLRKLSAVVFSVNEKRMNI